MGGACNSSKSLKVLKESSDSSQSQRGEPPFPTYKPLNQAKDGPAFLQWLPISGLWDS